MRFWDRHLFKDSRAWVCRQAVGDVLEVAIGTGMNLPHYPEGIQLTGVDFSPRCWRWPGTGLPNLVSRLS